MASNTIPADAFRDPGVSIPLTEKLSMVVYLAFLVVPRTIVNAAKAAFYALRRGVPVRMFLRSAVLGAALGGLTPGQLQYVSGTSVKAYRAWMKGMAKHVAQKGETSLLPSLAAAMQPLPDQSSILWLGDRAKATRFVLFFHGGGYVAPLLPGHMEWCWRVFVRPHVGSANEVAVAILDYTLCPAKRYPVQLQQAVASLQALLADGIRPEQILVGGDSAGGNLTAHLLSHLAHPTPVAPTVTIETPLLGAFLVSPLITADTTQRSMTDNDGIDMLTAKHIQTCGDVFYGRTSEVDLLARDAAAFDNMAAVVGDVLVTAGEQEVLRDQAVMFVDQLRQRNPTLPLRLDVAKDEGHDFILIEGQERKTGPAMQRMAAWATALIG